MNKEEYIARYGEAAWVKKMVNKNARNAVWMKKWREEHLEEARARAIGWKRSNPGKVREHDQEISMKGGRYYEAAKKRSASGIPNEKRKLRSLHTRRWGKYKKFVAPESHLHHSWRNDGTAGYDGLALVEADQHMHGFIDVIKVLEGEIKVFTEKEIREKGKSPDGK